MIAALLLAVLVADGGFYGAGPCILPHEVRIEAPAAPQSSTGASEQQTLTRVGPRKHLYNVCTVTHYCGCAACCGSWGNNTASGARPTAGWTVANNVLPFGTLIEINGHVYCVEDRGDDKMDAYWFDIYCNDHQEALDRGMYSTEVYIIE